MNCMYVGWCVGLVGARVVVRAGAQRLNLALGTGLGRLKGKAFRIGHLGALNELEVLATIAGVEMACVMAGIRLPLGAGLAACQRFFMEQYIPAPATS